MWCISLRVWRLWAFSPHNKAHKKTRNPLCYTNV